MKYTLIQPETIQLRESKGLVKDIYDPSTNIREPISAYRTMLALIQNNSTLGAAYDILMETAIHRGFDFIKGNKTDRDKLRKMFDDMRFIEVIPNLIYSLLYYGDAYLELRRKNSVKPNELFPLETTEMRIIFNIHGEIKGYVQRQFALSNLSEKEIIEKEKTIIPNEEGGNGVKTFGVFFDAEEVIHLRMKWLGSQVYSYNPNEAILQTATTRLYAGNYLTQIFLNMPPRYVAHLAGIGVSDFKLAKKEFQSTKTKYNKTIAFSKSSDPTSQLHLQKIDPPYDKTLIEILQWLDKELLKITRVPRTWVEQEGVENRGVGESITLPFDIRIKYLHRIVLEVPFNHELIPRVYKKGTESRIKFNEASRKGEKEILESAGLLRDMGLKPKALIRYLDEKGILGFDETDFDEQQLRKNMELNESRQRMNPNTSDMTQNRDVDGVSASSGKKMNAGATA